MAMGINHASSETSAITILPPLHEPTSIDEINHRIANSLQLLAAMVSVETRVIRDPEALSILGMIQRRIGAIGRVHRQLCDGHEATAVNLGHYLEGLGRDLEESWSGDAGNRMVQVRAHDLIVSSEDATSIGILVSELVANAFRHAYAPDAPGDVWITLRSLADGGFRLEVTDRGSGMTGRQLGKGGLGRRIIDMMARRLGARHGWRDAVPGTRFVLDAGRR